MRKRLKKTQQRTNLRRVNNVAAVREFFRQLNIPLARGQSRGVLYISRLDDVQTDTPRRRRSGMTPEKREAILSGIEQHYIELRSDPAAWQKEIEERRVWEITLKDGLPSV
jgi:hypothetical protein